MAVGGIGSFSALTSYSRVNSSKANSELEFDKIYQQKTDSVEINSTAGNNDIMTIYEMLCSEFPEANYILEDRSDEGNLFFNNVLTEKQLNDSVDVNIIIESLMMIDSNKDRELKSFTAGEKKKFVQYYSEKFKEEPDNQYEKMDKISEGLNRLGNHFEKGTKIPKLLMPLCVCGMYRMIKDNKSFEKYFNWLDNFLANYENNEEFLQYCNSGTTSAAKVQGRFQYFTSAMHDL